SAILWKPPAHSPEENMVRQKCSGIRRSYLEVECSLLGNGGVLSKSFSNKGTGFNVYMECRQAENGDIIVIWMLNLLIIRPLAGFRVFKQDLHSRKKFDELIGFVE
ncbi:hypothetical protein P9954_26820, partial [Serratia nevei]|nr:hypothetical protein [Serratia nevei]